MGLLDRLRRGQRPSAPVAEASSDPAPPVNVPRKGFEWGVSGSGTYSAAVQAMGMGVRTQLLQELYDVYVQCPPASKCVDVIARTVTAGGIQVCPDSELIGADGKEPAEPAQIAQLRHLFQFTNPTQDFIQLLRDAVAQLLVFGDAYIEIVWMAGVPFALYILNAVSMQVDADEHGNVRGYVQNVPGQNQGVVFEPNEVIHVSLDDPQGGLYGLSPTQKALLPITAWLFTTACLKERTRRGDPATLHIDLAKESQKDVDEYFEKFMVRNLGVKNLGTPVLTTRGGQVNVLSPGALEQLLLARNNLRDEIVGEYGVPPHKVGIVESGNLGGGTGESQDLTFKFNVCQPLATLVLEKLNYHVVRTGFGIVGWHLELPSVDYRDSKTVEDIRQQRMRSGAWTLNRYRRDIGEPDVEGGDDAVIVERGNFLFPRDIPAYVGAEMAKNAAPWVAAGAPIPVVDAALGITPEMRQMLDGEAERQAQLDAQAKLLAAQRPTVVPPAPPGGQADDGSQPKTTNPPAKPPAGAKKAPNERSPDDEQRAVSESYLRSYRARRRAALRQLPATEQLVEA